jgi:hypothetical protein
MKSRRFFLRYLAALPAAAATTSIAGVVSSSKTKGAGSPGGALPERNGGTVLSVTFSGPSVSIVEDDDVIVFFPKLEDHDAGVGTSVNETPFGGGDYEVLGLPAFSVESKVVFPPLRCNAQDPYTQAQKLRYFSVRLRRPDVLEGIHPVDVFLSDQATVPPDTPMQTFPTGLRFIYRGLPRDLSLEVSGPNSLLFSPNFDLDRQTGVPFYELKFQYVAGSRRDPCHQDATASFKKLLELFPAAGNVKTIKFAHEDQSCGLPSSSAVLTNTGLSLENGSSHGFNRPWLLRTVGPGSDCQSILMGHW